MAGSILPSLLNMSILKYSLNVGARSGLMIALGIVTIIFLQANIGTLLSNILMNNSEYIRILQIIGTFILFILCGYFLNLHVGKQKNVVSEDKTKFYLHGVVISSLNTFAIPFYFTATFILSKLNFFEYTVHHSIYFSVGSGLGSFMIYSLYIIFATKGEKKLTKLASKMNLILCLITGIAGLFNAIYLLK